MRELKIEQTIINDQSDCWVIAEVGHNHQGSVEMCKKMFDAAKDAGANAVKLQKRHNKSLYTKEFYDHPYNSENAYGQTYGLHREALEFDETQYRDLKQYAESLGLCFFASAFDFESVDFLANLDVPCFKIASADLKNTPLLRYVAAVGKPLIVSTGAAEMDDVKRAHDLLMTINPQVAILQCTASYPADFEILDLNVIQTYREAFPDVVVGLSDHDNGIAMSVAAYVLGARVIEKHFTLNRANKGTDHAFSLEPVGLQKMVRDLKRTRLALGDGVKKVYEQEKLPMHKMAKKIVVNRALPAGHVIQKKDLSFKSPGDGLPPHYADHFYGKELQVALEEEATLLFEHVNQEVKTT